MERLDFSRSRWSGLLLLFRRARESEAKASPPIAGARGDDPWLDAKDFSASNSVSIVLGEQESGHGLEFITGEPDGLTAIDSVNGVPCRRLDLSEFTSDGKRRRYGYFYFFIDPTFKTQDTNSVRIEVEYYNGKKGTLELQYDARVAVKDMRSKYTRTGPPMALDGAKEWETATFHIRDGAFEGAQNGGADFRLEAIPPEQLYVRRVSVTREKEED